MQIIPLPTSTVDIIIRQSRRVLGLSPEIFSQDSQAMAPPPQPAVAPQQDRVNVAREVSMPMFHGRHGEDGKWWLALFIRFASCYGWNDGYRLKYVPFYLKESASTWFINNEPEFPTWETFVTHFNKVYANSTLISHQAKEELRTRAQRIGETCHDYVQAVLKLCRDVDQQMPQNKKVEHVLKGIAENVYYMLHLKNFQTVNEILEFCQDLDNQLSKRISTPTAIQRLENALPFPVYHPDESHVLSPFTPQVESTQVNAVAMNEEKLVTMIEKVVKKTIEKMTPEVRHITAAIEQPRYSGSETSGTYRDTRECYYCGRRGHIQRFCRTRRMDFLRSSSSGYDSGYGNRGYGNREPVHRGNNNYNRNDVVPREPSGPVVNNRRQSQSPGGPHRGGPYRGRSPVIRPRHNSTSSEHTARPNDTGNRY